MCVMAVLLVHRVARSGFRLGEYRRKMGSEEIDGFALL